KLDRVADATNLAALALAVRLVVFVLVDAFSRLWIEGVDLVVVERLDRDSAVENVHRSTFRNTRWVVLVELDLPETDRVVRVLAPFAERDIDQHGSQRDVLPAGDTVSYRGSARRSGRVCGECDR